MGRTHFSLCLFVLFGFIMLYGEDIFVYESITQSRYHMIGNKICDGVIDSDGSFTPNLTALKSMIDSIKNKKKGGLYGGRRSAPFTSAKHPNEKVYEYRSGILVPMVFDEYRGLIPEVGGKIIDFKDYRYSPEARRIYNLPGRFVKFASK